MSFVLAARFRTASRANGIYRQVERVLYQGEPSDVSAYNILLDAIPHIVVLGEPPSETLQSQLAHLLAAGQAVALPAEVIAALRRRREQERVNGRWVEGHYRPGLRLPIEPAKPD